MKLHGAAFVAPACLIVAVETGGGDRRSASPS